MRKASTPLTPDARKRLLRVLASALAAGGVVWALLHALPWPAGAWSAFLVGTFPVLMLWRGSPPEAQVHAAGRVAVYYGSALTLWILAALSLGAAFGSGFTPRLIGWRGVPPVTLALWVLCTTTLAIVIVIAGRAAGIEESGTVRALLPRTRPERIAFAILCISAGICEETVFKSFLIPALATPLDSILLAALVSSAAFGILHAYQRFWGALRAGVLGVVLALPFVFTGSVLPSIITHAAIDLIAGFVLRDRLLGEDDRHALAEAS